MPKRKRAKNDITEPDYFDLHDFLNYIKEGKESEEMAELISMFYKYKESKGEFRHPTKFLKKYCDDYIHDIKFIDVFTERCNLSGKDALKILKKNNKDPVKFIEFLDALGDSISLSNPKHSKKYNFLHYIHRFGRIVKNFSYEDIVNCFISFHNEFSLAVNFIDAVNDFLKCFPQWNDEDKTNFFKILFLYPEHSYFLSHNKAQLFEAFPLLETIPQLGKIDDDVVIESDADENGNLKGFISSEDEFLSDSDDNENKKKNEDERHRKNSGDSDLFESLEEDNAESDGDGDDDNDDLESVIVEENSDENLSDSNNDEGDEQEDDDDSDDDDDGNRPNYPFIEFSASESDDEESEDNNSDITEDSTVEKITFL